ncbi:protein of unknown function [Paenibacillus sp. 1_12]|uniref:DUF4871 domain-containing protein n=1 Tax=Paenibacillus sp. 1_12 TaxID=1566278 RepID=UPI0008EF0E7F|nr:DUF4871 domain-containing protein [Paenibacillus sp. 1_12]SFL74976.1 protein of unknown function [Paenibacillus sp. 1_12]
MKEQPPQWSEAFSSSPFMKPRFTEQMKQDIIHKAKQRPQSKVKTATRFIPAMAILLVVGAIMVFTLLPKSVTEQMQNPASVGKVDPWSVRMEYQQNGTTLFNIFPDPNLSAGKPFGYMIHFTAPFDTFAGNQITINAFHKETGTRITALHPQTITTPSSGYPGLERFTTTFALPLSGIWRYEVMLNGQFYGDAVLSVAEPSWTVSPTFELPYTSGDGKKNAYVLVGEQGKAGFIVGPYINEKGVRLDQQPLIAGKGNKYMWHFWGADQELEGEFKVSAVKQGTTALVQVFSASQLGGGLNGADRTAVSSMSLPEPGRWRVMAYINDRLYSSIVVDVISN